MPQAYRAADGRFLIGIPLVGALVVFLAHQFFDVGILMGIIAVPLVFVFAIIAANATALTSITPTGALGKLTQLTYGVLAPGNMTTNVITASITGEVAGNASNLLMDIKPGYMLGGKPRHQAIGHVLGIFAGALAAVPVFYLRLSAGRSGRAGLREISHAGRHCLESGCRNPDRRVSANYPNRPSIAAIVGGLLGIFFEILKLVTKNRFPLSAVGIGLAFVIPFTTCLAMAAGRSSSGSRSVVHEKRRACSTRRSSRTSNRFVPV